MAEKNSLLEKVLSLQDKFTSLQNQLSDPAVMSDMKKYVQLNKDYKELEPIIKAGLEYKKMVDELAFRQRNNLDKRYSTFCLHNRLYTAGTRLLNHQCRDLGEAQPATEPVM